MKRPVPVCPPRLVYTFLLLLLFGLAYFPIAKIRAASTVPLVRLSGASRPFLDVQHTRYLKPSYGGDPGAVAALRAGAKPVSLTSADFDADGAPDLIAGYSTANGGVVTLTRGNPDAFAPKDPSLYQKAMQGQVSATFMSKATAYAVPGSADFLATADFDHDGYKDLLVGTSGGELYLLKGDGHGNLGAATQVALPGQVTALDVTPDGHLAVSMDGSGGPQLAVLAPGKSGFTTLAAYPLPAQGVAVAWGNLGAGVDVAVGGGNKLTIIYGALSANPQTETVSLSFNVQALTLGDFIWDRDNRAEISALGDDVAVHILQHGTLDTRPLTAADIPGRRAAMRPQANRVPPDPTSLGAWTEAKQVPAAASTPAHPLLQSSRLAGNGLMVADAAQNQLKILDASGKSASPLGAVELSGTPVAAHVTAQKISGARSLVVMTEDQSAPLVMDEAPDPTFNVTTTADEDNLDACSTTSTVKNETESDGTLSLREAVCEANNNGNATSMINLPAGTYDLAISTFGGNGSASSSAELQVGIQSGNNITISGAGAGSTIIQQTNGKDRIIEADQELNGSMPLAIQNLSLQLGNCTDSGLDCLDNGGGAILAGGATGDTLSLTNVVFNHNSTQSGAGTLGGAVEYTGSSLSITGSTFSDNTASGTGGAQGGAVQVEDVINAVEVSGSVTITNSTFTGNSALSGNNGNANGGGLFFEGAAGFNGSVTGSTFTGNTASSTGSTGAATGGGINAGGGGANTFSVSNSRIVGNSVSASSATASGYYGLNLDGTITNNWWGCNGGPGASGCDTVFFDQSGGGTSTFTPWLVLSISANPTQILPDATSTLTADLTHNSANTGGFSVPNGTPVTFGGTLDSSVNPTSSTLTSGQQTSTYTAGGTAGGGTGTAKVDNQTVSATINIEDTVIVTTSPGGLSIIVDNTTYTAPQTFNWVVGSMHTLNTTSPQSGPSGTQYVWNSWSQGGTQSQTVMAPSTSTTYTADFTTQYQLSTAASPSIGGTVSPTSGSYYNSTTVVPLTATPNGGYSFVNWTGNVANSTSATTSITMTAPQSVTANFSLIIVASPTTTSMSSNNNPSFTSAPGNSVTFTATVTSNTTVNEGTVTFSDPANNFTCSGGNTVPVSNGTASCTTSFGTEGFDIITAAYNGTVNFQAGSGNFVQFVSNHTVVTGNQYCNPGAVTIPNTNGPATPYPSEIFVSSFSGNLSKLTVTLNGISSSNMLPTDLLLVGPTGAKIIPFASVGDGSTISGVNITLDDAASSLIPGGSPLTSGTYKPTSITGSTTLVFPSPAPTVNAANYAATDGSATLASTFGNTSPNGNWSLYAMANASDGADSISGGWCINITGPAASISATGGGSQSTAVSTAFATPLQATVKDGGGNPLSNVQVTFTAPGSGASGTFSNNTATIITTTSPSGIAQETFTANNMAGAYNVAASASGVTTPASFSLANVAPPAISKGFSPTNIAVNGTSTLSFTITNPNSTVGLTGLAFSDSFPSGIQVASTPGATDTCGGIFSPAASATTVSLSGGTVSANGSCTLSVSVTGTTGGVKNNTTGAISSNEGGTGTTSNTAPLTVGSPATITKSFAPTTIAAGRTSTLSFTINNPNTSLALTGVAFSDTLPAGMVVSAPNALSGNCNGIVTATPASGAVSLSGGTVGAGSSCTFSVSVTGVTSGAWNNTTGALSSNEGGTGATSNTATLTVAAPPTISKAFGASTVALGGSTSLSFTISNSNAVSLSGVAFSDSLPSGLVVAASPGVTSTCGGTFTAAASATSVSLSGGTLSASTPCAISLNVTGTTAGVKNNTTGAISANESGAGTTSNTASITVVAPPTISKGFSPTTVAVNGNSTLSFTISNSNGATALTGLAFSDSFPAGVQVASTPGATDTCNGTFSAAASSTTISLTGGTVSAGGSCTLSVSVTGTTGGTKNNITGAITSNEGGTGTTSNTATLTVGTPGMVTKSFSPSTIPLNGTSTLTFALNNPNASLALSGISFSDSFPSGMQVASTPNATNTCNGTFSAAASATTVSLSGGSVSAGGSCSLTVSVTGTSLGVKNNTTGALSSNEGGTGATSNTATLTVAAPPTISKAFGASTVALGGSTSLSFTISNSNAVSLSGVAFSDSLPSGLVVAATPGVTSTCGGTFTAAASATSVSLSGGTLTASTPCAISLNVTGTTAGVKNNTTGAISANESGAGTTSNTASITVVAPPTISKGFSPTTVAVNGNSTLSFTISNSNGATALTGLAFSDSFPAGVQVASTPGATDTCNGTFSAAASSTTISLTGGTVSAGGSCTLSVSVTGTTGGTKNNITGAITSNEGGTGTTSNTATLTVGTPGMVTKSFSPSTIPLNGTSTLTFALNNPNASLALSGISFSDSFPSGMQVASTPNATNTCNGTFSAAASATTVSLSGGSVSAGGSCSLTVSVTGTSLGVKNNTTGALSSNEGGTGATSNTATLTVAAPPTISKAFGASTVALGGSTSLSFTISNSNAVSLSGVAFSDSLPSGLVVAASPGVTSTCGGTFTAAASATSVSLSGGTLSASTPCAISLNVTGTTAGVKNNTTGAISANESGAGTTSNTASITVVAPPTISKGFSPTTVAVNGNSTLSFTISNSNGATALTGLAFSDSFPAGVQVASTPGATDTCNGTFSAAASSTTISLTGGTVSAGGSCTLSVSVTGTTGGTKNNITGAITSNEGGTGTTSNTATLTVGTPGMVTKSFSPSTIPLNGTSTLTFALNNPNASLALSGISFSDSFPSGMQVASTPNATNTCNGTFSAAASATTVSLSGGSVSAGGSCSLTVSVTGTSLGVKNNTTGAVSANETGAGPTSNTATLTVAAPPTISKAFGASTVALGGSTSLSFTISNSNAVSLSGVAFSDSLPSGLVVAASPGVSSTCGGTFTAAASATSVSLSGGTLTASTPCAISLNVTGTTAGVKNNTTGAISANESGAGTTSNTASITVVAPPTISKGFSPTTVALNGTSTLSFTISNSNATTALTGLAFSDTFPAGIQVAATPGAVDNCGGTFSAAASSTAVGLTGGTVSAGSSCTISVSVTATTSGSKNNITGPISSNEGGTGTTSNTATLAAGTPPTISKAFSPTVVPVGGTSTLTFTIANPSTTVTQSGISFTDAFPAGIAVNSSPSASNSCGGTFTATANATSVSLSGGSLAASTSCTISVKVKGTATAVANNITGPISSTQGGTGATSNTATLTVTGMPVITKAFGVSTIPLNGTTSVTFSITNPNTTVATAVAFSDPLPSGLKVASVPDASNTCNGTLSASANGSNINLSGGSIAADGSCLISVNVTGTTAGVKNNTTGALTCNLGTSSPSNTATLTVVAPPTISKGFSPQSIAVNGSSTLSFTIANSNSTVALTGLAFSDAFPAGIQVAATPGAVDNCGGTFTATAAGTSVSLTGGTVAAGTSCTISVSVTGTTSGAKNNTTGAVSSTEGGIGATSNTATLNVGNAATIIKSFSPTNIAIGGTSTLSFTINNPNASQSLAGLAFSDSLPSGMQVASSPGKTNKCGGTFTATANAASVSLSGGSLAASSSCTLSVKVTSATSGVLNNTTGPLSSTQGGAGATSNTATLTVAGVPTIVKAFGVSAIPLNGTTSVTFTLTNPNTTTATSLSFSDPLPSGLQVASTPGTTNTCGGTVTAAANGASISLSGGSIAASASCAISVNVTGTTAGTKNNITGALTSNLGTGSASNTATLTVIAPPTISKGFSPQSVALNGSSTLSFTISNPNSATALTGVAFSDTLPAGMVVSTPNALSGSCNGTVTATAAAGAVSLAGGTVAAGSSCTFSVSVTATTSGAKNNTTGAVTSNEAGTGATSNTATLSVGVADLTITKTHTGNFTQGQTGATYTLTVSNVGGASTSGTVTVNDTLPAGLTATQLSGTGWTCTLSPLQCQRSTALTNGQSYPAITLTVNVASNAPSSVINSATVSGGGESNTANDTATDPTTINPATTSSPLGVSPGSLAFGNVYLGTQTFLPVTVTNNTAAAFQITDITITSGSGPAANDFSYTTTCNETIKAGKSCTITVDLYGQNLGSGTATLNITYNVPGSPADVGLSGTVVNSQ